MRKREDYIYSSQILFFGMPITLTCSWPHQSQVKYHASSNMPNKLAGLFCISRNGFFHPSYKFFHNTSWKLKLLFHIKTLKREGLYYKKNPSYKNSFVNIWKLEKSVFNIHQSIKMDSNLRNLNEFFENE